MVIFEKYHPLLSVHYELDWLTLFKLKDVARLRADAEQAAISGRTRDTSIPETATYVNRSMQLVMGNKALLYGIGDRRTHDFLGSICLWRFDADMTEAQLRFEALPETPAAVMAEIIPRVARFAFFELGLSTLYAILPATATDAIAQLTRYHFTSTPAAHERTLPDGRKVPLLKLTLKKTTVASDSQFHF